MKTRYCLLITSLAIASCEPGAQPDTTSTSRSSVTIDPVAGAVETPKQVSYSAQIPVPSSVSGADDSECGVVGGLNPDPQCHIDADQDGVVAKFDCDDNDPNISPFAVEVYCDGVDQNCNGFDECDQDGDGVLSIWDCDDQDPNIGLECTISAQQPLPILQ